jgi:putative transposase
LDESVYHCSIRNMYRIFGQHREVRERHAQLRHPAYQKPELLAERPNQVWSWDITKLMGPAKWSYFYFYVILHIFSRRVVGWCIADGETAALFKPLLQDAVAKHQVMPGQLTLHVDRGGPMKAKATACLLADLGVTRSHNRPHTANNISFSDSNLKTLKYQPRFPRRFGCIEDAQASCRQFFDCYNQDHHHAGIGVMTPDQVHYGQADAVHAARQQTLDRACCDTPERFVNKPPNHLPSQPPLGSIHRSAGPGARAECVSAPGRRWRQQRNGPADFRPGSRLLLPGHSAEMLHSNGSTIRLPAQAWRTRFVPWRPLNPAVARIARCTRDLDSL